MNKAMNRWRLWQDFRQRRTICRGLPVELVIEPTNQCNLRCVMCVRQRMTRPIGYMKLSLYRKIVDEVAGYLELLYLHGLGEPLFHPQLEKMITYARKSGLRVGISTNGSLLTTEKTKMILRSGLDYLIISLDATTPETYEKIRGGKNFLQTVKNVEDFLKLKKKSAQAPFTVIQFVKSSVNEKEAGAFRRKWQGKGAEVVRIKPVIDLLQEGKRAKSESGRPCFYLWRQLNMVSWDGTLVTPCCMDAEGLYPLGNANRQTVTELWNGRPMQHLRLAHRGEGWRRIGMCRDCTYPQPSAEGRIGALLLPSLGVKKILPVLENIFSRKVFFGD